MTKPTVELHPAHIWTCDDCGRDNYCRGIVVEPSQEERQEMEENFGEFVTGQWLTAPASVTCSHCGAVFETVDSRSEPE